MTLPTSPDNCPGKTEEPAIVHLCHCEEAVRRGNPHPPQCAALPASKGSGKRTYCHGLRHRNDGGFRGRLRRSDIVRFPGASVGSVTPPYRGGSAHLHAHIFPQFTDGSLLQSRHLSLGDVHALRHIHLGHSVVEPRPEDLLFPLAQPAEAVA